MYTHPIRLKHGDAYGVTEFHHQRFRKDERNCPEIRGLGTHFCEMQISQENLKRFRNKLPWQKPSISWQFSQNPWQVPWICPFQSRCHRCHRSQGRQPAASAHSHGLPPAVGGVGGVGAFWIGGVGAFWIGGWSALAAAGCLGFNGAKRR